jgi:vacuolar-type H+-ATPase subunit C/Vma6
MKYYFLVSYLPDLRREDKKIKVRFGDLLAEKNQIAEQDWLEVELVLLAHDIFLIEKLRSGKDMEVEYTLYDPEFWKSLVEFFQTGVSERLSPRQVNLLWEAYYDHVIETTTSDFLRGFFQFEKDLRNIIAAVRARRKGLAPSDHLVGESDVVDLLGRSSAEDFGLGREYAWVERLVQAQDPVQIEDTVEQILWEYIDQKTEHLDFEFDVVLAYLLKLELLEKRLSLSEEQGMAMVRQLEEL